MNALFDRLSWAMGQLIQAFCVEYVINQNIDYVALATMVQNQADVIGTCMYVKFSHVKQNLLLVLADFLWTNSVCMHVTVFLVFVKVHGLLVI